VRENKGEFERDYRPELERRRREREKEKESRRERELGKLMRDMNVGGKRRPKREEPETVSDMEDEDEEEVESDEDESGENKDGDLSQRYKQALRDDRDSGEPSHDDFSFAKYIRSANVGG